MRKELMSKTDKTDPSWVKVLRKDSPEVRVRHDHRFGPCDIDNIEDRTRPFYWQRGGNRCGYTVNYYMWNNGFFPTPRSLQYYRKKHESSRRAAWRNAKHDLLKLSGEDLEDYDV